MRYRFSFGPAGPTSGEPRGLNFPQISRSCEALQWVWSKSLHLCTPHLQAPFIRQRHATAKHIKQHCGSVFVVLPRRKMHLINNLVIRHELPNLHRPSSAAYLQTVRCRRSSSGPVGSGRVYVSFLYHLLLFMIHLFSFYLVLDSVSSQFVSGLGFFGLECDGVDCNRVMSSGYRKKRKNFW